MVLILSYRAGDRIPPREVSTLLVSRLGYLCELTLHIPRSTCTRGLYGAYADIVWSYVDDILVEGIHLIGEGYVLIMENLVKF